MENRSKTVNVTPTPNRSRRPPQRLIDDDVWPQKVLNLQLLLFMCVFLKISFTMNSFSISLQFSLLKCETKKCWYLKSKAHKENKKQQAESKTEVQELDDFASFLTKCTLFCGNYD